MPYMILTPFAPAIISAVGIIEFAKEAAENL